MIGLVKTKNKRIGQSEETGENSDPWIQAPWVLRYWGHFPKKEDKSFCFPFPFAAPLDAALAFLAGSFFAIELVLPDFTGAFFLLSTTGVDSFFGGADPLFFGFACSSFSSSSSSSETDS